MIRAVLPGFSASKPRLRVTEQYFAFYWTLPVPWAGFIRLPDGVDEAAQVSRTIRYQRDRIRQDIRIQRAEMAPGGEMVRLELAPDRGSAEIAADFGRLLNRAMAENAMVAIIDFASHAGWRRHSHLVRHYQHPCCDRIEITPEEAQLAGFNPIAISKTGAIGCWPISPPSQTIAQLFSQRSRKWSTSPSRHVRLRSIRLA